MKRNVAVVSVFALTLGLLVAAVVGSGCGKSSDRPEANATNVVILSEANFQNEVIAAPQPVLVDFWAPWCGPCRTIGPIVNELAKDFDGRAKVAKVNVDDAPALAQRFEIQGIPTILIFRDGRVVDQVTGVVPRRELTAKLDKVIAESGKSSAAPTNR